MLFSNIENCGFGFVDLFALLGTLLQNVECAASQLFAAAQFLKMLMQTNSRSKQHSSLGQGR